MSVPETELIKRLMQKGIMRTLHQEIEVELARELAEDIGFEVYVVEAPEVATYKSSEAPSVKGNVAPDGYSAVVTFVGHTGHGKTSLFDAVGQTRLLRKSVPMHGITRQLGGYHLGLNTKISNISQLNFIDNPDLLTLSGTTDCHSKDTNIAILVVAADEGVKQQTIDAINSVKGAGIPIIVALNKIDKAGANSDRVLSQLMEHGLLAERYGGNTITCEVVATELTGVGELLDMIVLVALAAG